MTGATGRPAVFAARAPSVLDAARAAVVPFVVSRVLVLASLAVARHLVDTLAVGVRPVQVDDGLLGWDAAWYAAIARGGYDAVAVDGLRFFPLVPLLARAVALLPGVDTDLALVLVANGAALLAGIAVHVLAAGERDERFARRAVWLLYLAPPAFVLVMGYAESTLVLATAVALLALRRRRWWAAAAAGLAAGLTRPLGVLAVLPALVEVLRAPRPVPRRELVARAGAVVAPAAGLYAYLAWAADRGESFLYPLRVHEDPTRRGAWRFPVTNVVDTAREFAAGDRASAGLHVATALVLVALVVVLARRWPASYSLYALAAVVIGLGASNLDSLERYSLSTVPLVLAAADVVEGETAQRVVFVGAGAGLVALATLAFTGVLVP